MCFDLVTCVLLAIDYVIVRLIVDSNNNTDRCLLLLIDTMIWLLAVTHKSQ